MTRILLLEIVDEKLKDYYVSAVKEHNKSIKDKGSLADSGFDLICPETIDIQLPLTKLCSTVLINLKVKAVAYDVRNFQVSQIPILSNDLCRAYDLCVRSSIYKTSFRLANNVGIIDSSYRGPLHAAMDYNKGYGKNTDRLVEGNRYWQIVMPSREPFKVYIVKKLNETERGEGGLGSTGEGGLKK